MESKCGCMFQLACETWELQTEDFLVLQMFTPCLFEQCIHAQKYFVHAFYLQSSKNVSYRRIGTP